MRRARTMAYVGASVVGLSVVGVAVVGVCVLGAAVLNTPTASPDQPRENGGAGADLGSRPEPAVCTPMRACTCSSVCERVACVQQAPATAYVGESVVGLSVVGVAVVGVCVLGATVLHTQPAHADSTREDR